MSGEYALGIDIGGTKVAVAVVNQKGEYSARYERLSDITSADALFQTVLNCIENVLEQSGLSIENFRGIGVGVPGKVDIENGIALSQNNIPWKDFPIVRRLKEKFGYNVPVIVDNDVKMAAFAEYKTRHLEVDHLFSYVTISTGLATTNILNNNIIRGNGFSGEIGFLPFKKGTGYVTLEDYAAGPAIQKALKDSKTTKEVFDRAASGDQHALRVIQDRAHALALGLYSIVCILDPSSIVLGGSVAFHNPLFVEEIIKELSSFISEEQLHILGAISKTVLGGDNGVIGAGLSLFNQLKPQ